MPGPWEKYQKPNEGQAAEGPWSKYQAPPAEDQPAPKGVLQAAAEGLGAAARTVDSYTGAPARAAIGAAQDGKGFFGSIGAGASQFGEDPDLAPTGRQIAVKAGASEKPWGPVYAGKGGRMPDSGLSTADVAGLGIDMAADLTNIIPVAKAGKMLGSAAVKNAGNFIKGTATVAERAEQAIGRAGRRVIQGGFGVPEEAINNYLAKLPELKGKVGAREMAEELAGKLDQGLKPARDQLAAAEAAVASAKAKRSEDLAELLLKRQEAKDSLRLAEQQALGEAASRVSGRVNQLNKEVSEGSAKAFDILDNEGVRVPVTPIKSDLTKGIKALEETAITDEQMGVVDLLKRYRERLDKFGKDIPGGEAKRLIQSLDREMGQLAPGSISRLSKDDQVLGILRKRFDTPLKASPAYAEQMKGVASDTRLLMGTKDLASESAAARALQAAGRATGKDQAAIIQALEAKYGDKLLESVTRSNLPEYAKLKGVISRYRAAKKGLGVKEAEQSLGLARDGVGDVARLADSGVAGITDNISSYVRAGQPSAKQSELLSKAGQVAGVDMPSKLKDIKTISAFEKGYTRGSANTNFWGAIAGGAAGSLLGPGGAVGGLAAGGAFGRMVIDNFGPAVGRKILDATPMLKRMAPSEWIRRLDVPAPVKQALEQDLIYQRTQAVTRIGAAASKGGQDLKQVAEQPKGEDRWAQSGLDKLGIKDSSMAQQLLQSKEGKRLLIEASDLQPGSTRMMRIMEQIKSLQKGQSHDSLTRTPPAVLRLKREPASSR